MDNEEEEDTCVSILKDKAEKTSLHGIGHIVQCRHRYQQALWTLLVLGLVGFLVFQLNDLFSHFMDHPVKTSVSLEFTHLKFPAVSFCNMNQVRNSMKGKIESEQLKRILTVRNPSIFPFYMPVFRPDVLWYADVRPDLLPSVSPSHSTYYARHEIFKNVFI